MLNIVLPMAGHGSRFAMAGYADPKPLLKVGAKSMIQTVVENLRPARPHRFVFLCQARHLRDYDLERHLRAIAPGCAIVPVDGVTEGAACTVLLAHDWIGVDAPLMIANCDQYVDTSIDAYLADLEQRGLDGGIMTMHASDPKWSYVRLDGADRIVEVVEKRVVSREATVGIYNFARGGDFLEAAGAMIARDERVNGEFYVAPAYNDLIRGGAVLGYYNIGADRDGMYGLGVPEDLAWFVAHRVVGEDGRLAPRRA